MFDRQPVTSANVPTVSPADFCFRLNRKLIIIIIIIIIVIIIMIMMMMIMIMIMIMIII